MYGLPDKHLSKPTDKYGFVDENEVRTTAGIMLILALFSFFLVIFKGEFLIPLILVGIMWVDFLLKTIFSPQWSIFGSIVRIFRHKKSKNMVGAVQKRFAWSIGLFLSTFVLFCILVLGSWIDLPPPEDNMARAMIVENIKNAALIVTPMNPAVIACLLCIVFMWCESVLGYCVGCHIYRWLVKKGWLKKYPNQNCADGSCSL